MAKSNALVLSRMINRTDAIPRGTLLFRSEIYSGTNLKTSRRKIDFTSTTIELNSALEYLGTIVHRETIDPVLVVWIYHVTNTKLKGIYANAYRFDKNAHEKEILLQRNIKVTETKRSEGSYRGAKILVINADISG